MIDLHDPALFHHRKDARDAQQAIGGRWSAGQSSRYGLHLT